MCKRITNLQNTIPKKAGIKFPSSMCVNIHSARRNPSTLTYSDILLMLSSLCATGEIEPVEYKDMLHELFKTSRKEKNVKKKII